MERISENFNIKSISEIGEWANGKKLVLPDLQRDYVWGKEQWKRLWDDVVDVLNNLENNPDSSPQHFMGVLTVKQKSEKTSNEYQVLDGQQRLTTISVLLDYLNYALGNKPTESSLSFFKNNIAFEANPINNDNAGAYLSIYKFFMDCHYDMNYAKAKELSNIVNNRMFFALKITEENEHDVFENLNATGKNLEFADLILNHLMEKSSDKEKLKIEWNNLISKLNGISVANQDDDANESGYSENEEDVEAEDTEVISENVVISSALKLKKFLNAMNSVTMDCFQTISETIADFDAMVKRLDHFGVLSNDIGSSDSKITTLARWESVYEIIVDPLNWSDIMLSKPYAKELYYLSLWHVTGYIPVLMRIIYRNIVITENYDGHYNDKKVKNLLKAILKSVVHTRIILNRKHAEDMDIEKKIRVLDYIFDSYSKISLNNNKFGENEVDIAIILSNIINVEEDIENKSDNAIKTYQYTSSGSKFLLALYADDLKKNCSSIYELEKENGRAQVEHMVPQNLEGGGFADYGFGVGSIGLLDNLILLSEKKNQEIGNCNPEDKVSKWNEDEFGKLFIKEKKNWKEIESSRECKVRKICDNFKEYFSCQYSKVGKLSFTFAKKEYSNGKFQKLDGCSANKLCTGNEKDRYLRINENSFEEHPKKVDNSAKRYYFGNNVIGDEKFTALGMITDFIKYVSPDGSIYDWLKKCEGTISVIKNGSEKVSINSGDEFTYSQKMIHTDELEKCPDISKIMGRARHNKNNSEIEINSKKLYICNDFNIIAIIDTLSQIYQHFNKKNTIGFWVEVQQEVPIIIDKVLIQTNYINIGDYDIYKKWIKEQYNGKINTNANSSTITEQKKITRYFNCGTESFEDISKYNLSIPEYQRAYVWDERNWTVLYSQLLKATVEKPIFLGTIALMKELKENKEYYSIVDGQQRLTTLFSFCYAKNGKKADDKKLFNQKPVDFISKQKGKIDKKSCFFDIIFIENYAPIEYQYEVFSSINSTGKKLTIEEKIKNYLLSIYPESDANELKEIADNPGFAKALCECINGKFCKSDDIYNSYKKIVQASYQFDILKSYSDAFYHIKDTSQKSGPIWLTLINGLNVTTADSLLLNCYMRIFSKGQNSENNMQWESVTQKICIIYFLLYVMDRSGNGAKSANNNFPKCMNLTDKSLASQIICSEADLPYWNEVKKDVSPDIWDNYIKTLPIYDLSQARIKRFILLMLEYMMIDDGGDTMDNWMVNVHNQEKLDIEHIFPSSEKKCLNAPKNKLISADRLNYLENVMLLETTINKKVKDNMLSDKLSEYKNSKLFMVKMFKPFGSKCPYVNRDGVYDACCAEKRMNKLKERIVDNKHFSNMLELVRGKEKLVDDQLKLPDSAINIFSKDKKAIRKPNSVQSAGIKVKKKNKAMQNVIQVVITATRIAIVQKGEGRIINADAIKNQAIEQILRTSGKDKKYASTIRSNITRELGVTSENFSSMLSGLWKGEITLTNILKSRVDIPKELYDLVNRMKNQ